MSEDTNVERLCPDCSAKPGGNHAHGCDVERCPACGGQRLSCTCQTRRRPLPWSGEWPGVMECREFGWYSFLYPGRGWIRCAKDHPGATEDLNRLYVDARWDAQRGRFCLPHAQRGLGNEARRNGFGNTGITHV
jgi:hypothetical protein